MRLILIAAALALSACTNGPDTVRTLQDSGFTDIETTGYSWFSCGHDDTYHTGFRAKNPRGKVVEGTVCCGFWAKGCTIRW